MQLDESDAVEIMSAVLGRLLREVAGKKTEECDLIGYVIELTNADTQTNQKFLVECNQETGSVGIRIPPKDAPYKDGDIIYGCFDGSTAVVKAALHGDNYGGVVRDEPVFTGPDLQSSDLPSSYCDVCGKKGSEFCHKDSSVCPYPDEPSQKGEG